MSEKLTPEHLARAAYVYVRQSTGYQVRRHVESRRRQYGLAERARQLGFAHVEVIDEDLGVSGTGSKQRPGFARLLAAVCEGEVGAVLALEASRLARNSRDWHHLIDLCALAGAVVIDDDGVYEPRQLNDRLLLGLKGTMSEFELGLLRQRAQEALRQMVQRGAVLTELPVGYVRTEDNQCEKSPDLQVQAAIEGVFAKFRELGSARQVLLWYRQEGIPLPEVRPATQGREIVWRLPTNSRILAILHNPTYAGAFAYGRRRSRTRIVDGRARKTSGHEVPMEQWEVLLKDRHPGYITWPQYLRNRHQLRDNSNMGGQMTPGAAKRGVALLSGLIRCARCGRKLHVSYSGSSGKIVRYHCKGGQINHGVEWCISFAGRRVDAAVAARVLEVIRPAGIEAALEAHETLSEAEDEKRRQLRLSVERARYQAERARRQYDAAEPENRLVAAELERRWNQALAELASLEQRLEQLDVEHDVVTEDERRRLLDLGRELEEAWNHPGAPHPLKKRILRSVLQEIVADIRDEPAEVILHLHWLGGDHTRMTVPKNRTGEHSRRTDRKVVDLICELAEVCEDRQIASILNRLGYRTGADNTWTASRIASARHRRGVAPYDTGRTPAWSTAQQAADHLGISEASVRRLLHLGVLPGTQIVPHAPWVIRPECLDLPDVQAAVRAIQNRRKLPPSASEQDPIPFLSITS
jgi:DNA invertase Pin-like site-specific DNA recombinase